MAHEIHITKEGKASTAWVGIAPWHGLGQEMKAGSSLEEWSESAGFNWTAEERPLYSVDQDGLYQFVPTHKALVRSDTKFNLSVVSKSYKVVQPNEVLEFYRDLTEKFGFEMHTAGVLKEGRRIWALAHCPVDNIMVGGIDEVRPHLLLSTSFDGSMATTAMFCAERVVCNNTLTIALNENGAKKIAVNHSRSFDPDSVKIDLGIGPAWKIFKDRAERMSQTNVTEEEQVGFLLDTYFGIKTPEDKSRERKLISRLASILRDAPGATIPTAFGTVWGLLNAVTHDVDFSKRISSQDSRFSHATFGGGNSKKQRAFDLALEMIGE